MNVAILVPRRSDGGRRDRLWSWCRARWEATGWPIIEGVDDSDGPFNRSAAVNAAAREGGGWDVAVIVDADAVISLPRVVAAVDRHTRPGRLLLPYQAGRRLMLPREFTNRILRADPAGPLDADVWRRHARPDPYLGHRSSVVIVPRGLWDRVGGMDERFVGWGGEDDAFADACETLGGLDRLDGEVWHLWHRPALRDPGAAALLAANRALQADYEAAYGDPEAMARLVATRGG